MLMKRVQGREYAGTFTCKKSALIDEIEVDFAEGLNILTGETGAGKSVLIGSVNLALGQKLPEK